MGHSFGYFGFEIERQIVYKDKKGQEKKQIVHDKLESRRRVTSKIDG